MPFEPVGPGMALQPLHGTAAGDMAVPAGRQTWGVLRHGRVDEGLGSRPEAFEPERRLEGAEVRIAFTMVGLRIRLREAAHPPA
jgi:hypothetical protein